MLPNSRDTAAAELLYKKTLTASEFSDGMLPNSRDTAAAELLSKKKKN
jgi:hypothetical protein